MSTPAKDPAALLDADQVAARLGCSLRLVRQFSAERRIPFVKVGRLTRFKPSDVESFVEANTVREIHWDNEARACLANTNAHVANGTR